ncbi:MAG: glycosyltransferase family 39 protein [Candidatus Omnitrophota bacterium]|jgi:4-amino-4-deoxy-L-arabinose transferase-like glycosyltransferase
MSLWLSQHKTVICVFLLLTAVIFYCWGVNNILPLQEDSAIYIIFAQSLSKGQGYLYTAGPQDVKGNYYPFFYPSLLSPWVYFFPHNYLVLKLITVFFAIILIMLLLQAAPFFFDKELSLLVVILAALSPQMVLYAQHILSEIPYTLFSLLAVYSLCRYRESKSSLNGHFLLFVLSAGTAYYTRMIGVSLFIAAIVFFGLFKRDMKRALIFVIVFIMLFAPWIIRNMLFGHSAYTAEFVYATSGILAFLNRWIYNLLATISVEFPDLFFYPFFVMVDAASQGFIFKAGIGCGIAVCMIAGFWRHFKKQGIQPGDVYVLVYFFVLYLSWTHHGARYLVPIIPFLLYYFLRGIQGVMRGKKLTALVIAFLLVTNVSGNIVERLRLGASFLTPAEKAFVSSADWIKKHGTQNCLVMSRRPNWLYMYTDGLRGIKFMLTTDTRAQYEYITSSNVDYFIIDQNKIYRDSACDYLLPLVFDYPDRFKRVFVSPENPKAYVYQVVR